jgi:hypothetical protein
MSYASNEALRDNVLEQLPPAVQARQEEFQSSAFDVHRMRLAADMARGQAVNVQEALPEHATEQQILQGLRDAERAQNSVYAAHAAGEVPNPVQAYYRNDLDLVA